MDTPYSSWTFDEVASTQDEARERAAPGRPAVVVAHRQTGGRGRSGSGWVTAPRAVATSVGMIPAWAPDRLPLLPLVAGVAARRTLGPAVGLKWPNDLVVGASKVGGILVEARDGVVVAGLGLNLYWPDPLPGAGALFPSDPGREEGPRLGVAWAESLLALVDRGPERWPGDEYREGCVTLGQEISWEPDGRGRAVGISADGSLQVVTSDGRSRSLSAGAIRHLRAL
ncbi:MAG: biotin--[acetyl-CoA-carboxylase] ligase [Actinomycetota bacterium]